MPCDNKPVPVHKGVRRWGDTSIDGGIGWEVYDGLNDKTNEEILEILGYSAYYGGVGRPFTGGPMIQRTSTRVLITQDFGWDI